MLVNKIILSYVDLIGYLGSLKRSGGTSQSISWPSKMMSFRRLPQGSLTWHSLSNRPGMLTLLLNFVGDSNSIKRKTQFPNFFLLHFVYMSSSSNIISKKKLLAIKILAIKFPLSDFLFYQIVKIKSSL